MKNAWLISIALSAFLISTTALQAQEGEKPDAERIATAQELLIAMDAEETYVEGIVNTVDLQISQNPALKPLGPVLLEFFRTYASWEMLSGRFAEVYAREFSTDEMKELIQFCHTDLGKKVARVTPKIQGATSKSGFEIGVKHQAELQQMIMEEMELQQESDADPNFPY